jgi:hypothetical protein
MVTKLDLCGHNKPPESPKKISTPPMIPPVFIGFDPLIPLETEKLHVPVFRVYSLPRIW